MRIAVFTYTFGTAKTEQHLQWMIANGFHPAMMVAAPPVKLDHYQSRIRIVPKEVPHLTPLRLAITNGIPYCEEPHNCKAAQRNLREMDIDVGVILGARILSRETIAATRLGILNLHPGILPGNRGLDTHKWAVWHGLPQGATAHLIDHRIDCGRIIGTKEVPVFQDDSMLDLVLRVHGAERELMVDALQRLSDGERDFPESGSGEYRHAMPPDKEAALMVRFQQYKKARRQK